MTSTLPRTLALLALVCLASAGQAEDHAAPIPDKADKAHADPSESVGHLRRWFRFPWKPRVVRRGEAHKVHVPPPLVNSVVLAGLLGGGLGLWFVLLLIRWRMKAARTQRQAREKTALIGAQLGFPAGMWIYDKLYPYSVDGANSLQAKAGPFSDAS